VPVTVRRIPLANFIWAGLLLPVLGLALVMGSERATGHRQQLAGNSQRGLRPASMGNGQREATGAEKRRKRKVAL
jgi:hypothetical protein